MIVKFIGLFIKTNHAGRRKSASNLKAFIAGHVIKIDNRDSKPAARNVFKDMRADINILAE